MSTTPTFADVSEGVHAAIAAYTQALDDGRASDVVATFCPNGTCDMPGLGRRAGHADLLKAYERWAPKQPQRHLVLNTLITQWSDVEAHATSDVVFLLKDDSGWSVQFVGRYADVLHRDGNQWRFHSRIASFS